MYSRFSRNSEENASKNREYKENVYIILHTCNNFNFDRICERCLLLQKVELKAQHMVTVL